MRLDAHVTCLAALLLPLLPSSAFGQAWAPAPAFPDVSQGRTGCTALNRQGTLFVIGGRPFSSDGDANAAVHYLGLGAAEWTQAQWLEGPVVGQGAGIDGLGRIVVFGGRDGVDPQGDLGRARVYDPVDGFTDAIAERSTAAPPLNFATATDADHRVYSIGGGPGEDATLAASNTAYCERYNAIEDAWEAIAPVPFGVAGAAAVHDGQGHILVIGGIDAAATARLATVLQYDIAGNTWSDRAVPDLASPTSDARAVLGSDNRIYLLGGRSGPVGAGIARSDVHVLNLTTNTWSDGPSMITPRYAFASALGDDDCIYAMGGEGVAGGTWLVEKLYTPPCPVIVQPPVSRAVWQHQPVTLSADAEGGSPLAYRWQKDGEDLQDGTAAGGGTISGAATTSLMITDINTQDEGEYRLVASNPCGSAASDPAVLTVRLPPAIPTDWEVVNLHPSWAASSRANAVYADAQVGSASKEVPPYGSLDRPVLWHASAPSAVDLTPPGSVGGGCNGVSDVMQVGWWWWPYQCYVSGKWQTCHTRQACAWYGSASSYDNLQYSGWEYSVANDVEGSRPAGTVTTDDAVGNTFAHGGIWTGSSLSFQSLHPEGVSKSFVNAIAEGHQYGFIHTPFPGPQVHAAMWTGSSTTFLDVHPAGASRSWISGAGSGQAVGMAEFGSNHAAMWYDSPDSFTDMNPPGAASSSLHDAAGGLQVGAATIGGLSQAGLWRGTPESFASLHDVLPPEFVASSALGIYVAHDGVICVVGYASNSSTGRSEAILWRFDPFIPQDLDRDSDVDLEDYALFEQCATGPVIPLPAGCENRDYDHDNDVDQSDFGLLQRCFSGANGPPERTCAG